MQKLEIQYHPIAVHMIKSTQQTVYGHKNYTLSTNLAAEQLVFGRDSKTLQSTKSIKYTVCSAQLLRLDPEVVIQH